MFLVNFEVILNIDKLTSLNSIYEKYHRSQLTKKLQCIAKKSKLSIEEFNESSDWTSIKETTKTWPNIV